MMISRTGRSGPGRQRGASSLFITVILVLVVMLLAVTAAVLSSTQFKLAGNLQYENVAFNLAEGALASAESWLSTQDAAATTPMPRTRPSRRTRTTFRTSTRSAISRPTTSTR